MKKTFILYASLLFSLIIGSFYSCELEEPNEVDEPNETEVLNEDTPPTTSIIDWQKVLGGSNTDDPAIIKPTTDGGYIIAGSTYSYNGDIMSNHGKWDCWIVKLNNSGNIQWQKTLGGTQDDGANSISPTTDGGYIVAGYTLSNDGDIIGHHGSRDFWVVKLDNNGNIQWQKALGGSSTDIAYSVSPTADGGYIVAGETWSNNGDVTDKHGNGDCWVVKLDNSGNIQWQKAMGGGNNEVVRSVSSTDDGGYIVAGQTGSNNGDVMGNNGGGDYWIVKLDNDGNIQWQKTLGGSGNDIAYSLILTTEGGYIVAGETRSNNGDVVGNSNYLGQGDYWIVKLDNNGNIQWQKAFGGSSRDIATNISSTSDGGYIVAGHTSSKNGDVIAGNHGGYDYWIIKLDNNGNIKSATYPLGGSNTDEVRSMVATANGGCVIAGYTKSNNGDVEEALANGDFWILKLTGF